MAGRVFTLPVGEHIVPPVYGAGERATRTQGPKLQGGLPPEPNRTPWGRVANANKSAKVASGSGGGSSHFGSVRGFWDAANHKRHACLVLK